MNEPDSLLTRIINWADNEGAVRALILEGSRASNTAYDELADFDIKVFTTTHEQYTEDDRWLTGINRVWVYSSDQYEWRDEMIPTRLVIFEGGLKVDFSFVSVNVLSELADSTDFNLGYRVLLDKDGKTGAIPPPTYQARQPPPLTENDFRSLVKEFWFEVYHVAKYLKRGELWIVKSRDWATKELLLKMIEWHARATREWSYGSPYTGKHMSSLIDERIWQALHHTFARFDKADSCAGLLATIDLFRDLARETAVRRGFVYPEDVDRNMTGFILKLKDS